jgi:hypothetical protein
MVVATAPPASNALEASLPTLQRTGQRVTITQPVTTPTLSIAVEP